MNLGDDTVFPRVKSGAESVVDKGDDDDIGFDFRDVEDDPLGHHLKIRPGFFDLLVDHHVLNRKMSRKFLSVNFPREILGETEKSAFVTERLDSLGNSMETYGGCRPPWGHITFSDEKYKKY